VLIESLDRDGLHVAAVKVSSERREAADWERGFGFKQGELMSELSRWKEYRIRQAIYLESLKQEHTPSIQSGSNGSNLEVRRVSAEALPQGTLLVRANRRIVNRKKNDRSPEMVLHVGLLAGSVVIWLLLWWVEFGIHR
jgi:hypothetical protein